LAAVPSHFFACFPDIRCLENPQLNEFLRPAKEMFRLRPFPQGSEPKPLKHLMAFGQDNVSKNLLPGDCSTSRQKASFDSASIGQLATIVR
jgi:hypothetical protein